MSENTTAPEITTEDLNRIATDLNNKADKDLTNINPSQVGGGVIVNLGVPDYSNPIEITSFPYTVTEPCLVQFFGAGIRNGYIFGYINGTLVIQLGSDGYQAGERAGLYPVQAGDVLTVQNAAVNIFKYRNI